MAHEQRLGPGQEVRQKNGCAWPGVYRRQVHIGIPTNSKREDQPILTVSQVPLRSPFSNKQLRNGTAGPVRELTQEAWSTMKPWGCQASSLHFLLLSLREQREASRGSRGTAMSPHRRRRTRRNLPQGCRSRLRCLGYVVLLPWPTLWSSFLTADLARLHLRFSQ